MKGDKKIYRKPARETVDLCLSHSDGFLGRSGQALLTSSRNTGTTVYFEPVCDEDGALERLELDIFLEAQRLDQEDSPIVWHEVGMTSDGKAFYVEIHKRGDIWNKSEIRDPREPRGRWENDRPEFQVGGKPVASEPKK